MSPRFRPLWFFGISLVWALLGYFFTLKLDAWGMAWADLSGATSGVVVVAVAGLPWALHSGILLAALSWWVVADPAWHPWRNALLAGTAAAVGSAAIHLVALLVGHIERDDLAPAAAGATVLALCLALAALAWVPVSIVAANRIWGTPEPKREKRFGPRPKQSAP